MDCQKTLIKMLEKRWKEKQEKHPEREKAKDER